MAEEVAIVGTNEFAKKRNPLGVFGLTLITLGIYHFFWWYYVNKEMVELGRAKGTGELGDSPGTSLLALFPGFLIIVPPLVSYYKGVQRMQAAARLTGAEPVNGWLALIIFLVIGFVFAPVPPELPEQGLGRSGGRRGRRDPGRRAGRSARAAGSTGRAAASAAAPGSVAARARRGSSPSALRTPRA